MSKVDTWIPLHVAEYVADTMRFTAEQHGCYLLLILDYWRSGPPPDDDEVLAQIVKLPIAKWKKQRSVLAAKFVIEGGLWKHKRIEREIAKAKGLQQASSERGKKGAAARWNKDESSNGAGNATGNASSIPEAMRGHMLGDAPVPDSLPSSLPTSLPPPDSQPTPQPGPKAKARKRAAIRPDGVSEKVWNDFLEVRKAKRAPLTDTALEGIEREAKKAGMSLQAALEMACARGWQGFEAKWLNGGGRPDPFEQAGREIFGDQEKDVTHESERL